METDYKTINIHVVDVTFLIIIYLYDTFMLSPKWRFSPSCSGVHYCQSFSFSIDVRCIESL